MAAERNYVILERVEGGPDVTTTPRGKVWVERGTFSAHHGDAAIDAYLEADGGDEDGRTIVSVVEVSFNPVTMTSKTVTKRTRVRARPLRQRQTRETAAAAPPAS